MLVDRKRLRPQVVNVLPGPLNHLGRRSRGIRIHDGGHLNLGNLSLLTEKGNARGMTIL